MPRHEAYKRVKVFTVVATLLKMFIEYLPHKDRVEKACVTNRYS
jgi:hypothetical protein